MLPQVVAQELEQEVLLQVVAVALAELAAVSYTHLTLPTIYSV